MDLHPEELRLARLYQSQREFPKLTSEQLADVRRRGQQLHAWTKAHPTLHAAISLLALGTIFAADLLTMAALPELFPATPPWQIVGGVAVGALHGYFMYCLIIYTIHEGAAHDLIIQPRGPVSRVLGFLCNNLGRLADADPLYYADSHRSHHAYFGTERDAEFVSCVAPRRLALTLLPYAAFLRFVDFKAHGPLNLTKSRLVTMVFASLYQIPYILFLATQFSWTLSLVAMVLVMPQVSFILDRLRQYTEHNLMPLENLHGARNLGLGFWAMLIGGGPTGQPCHWAHHLVATLPWYGQLALHRHLLQIMSEEQKRQYFPPPGGFPVLLARILREKRRLHRLPENEAGGAASSA